MFANSEILANKVILQEINDTNKNEYELSFKLDKVALIKSESFEEDKCHVNSIYQVPSSQ